MISSIVMYFFYFSYYLKKVVINKTLDNTLNKVKRTTDEATRDIPRYTYRIAEYQEQTIQTMRYCF